MKTSIHQSWDLGEPRDGCLTLDLLCVKRLPSGAYDVLADLQRDVADAVDRLTRMLDGAS